MTDVSFRAISGTIAENYERYFVPTIARPVASDLLATAELRPGERVLDVACGTGVIARLAAGVVGPRGSVTAIDVAPDMIDVARRAGADGGADAASTAAIEWHVGDASSLPFADQQYDVVTCQMGLMFVPDRAAAIAEMRRVLVPGGRVVLSTPGAIQPPFALLAQAIVDHIHPDLGGFVRAVFSMHDPALLSALLQDAGLDDVRVRAARTALRLPGPAEFLWQYVQLTPLGSFVAQASDAARAAMEQQVVETWRPYTADGATSFEQPMVLARAARPSADV
jgi:ubiquinone/menaquinone biosynthesis C-methylase UbiE